MVLQHRGGVRQYIRKLLNTGIRPEKSVGQGLRLRLVKNVKGWSWRGELSPDEEGLQISFWTLMGGRFVIVGVLGTHNRLPRRRRFTKQYRC